MEQTTTAGTQEVVPEPGKPKIGMGSERGDLVPLPVINREPGTMRFASGTRAGGRPKGSLAKISATVLADLSAAMDQLGLKSNPFVLLAMVVASETLPLRLRVDCAKSLAGLIAPKLLEITEDVSEQDNGGIVEAVAADPTLQALYEAYQRRQVIEAKRKAGLLPPAADARMIAPPDADGTRSTYRSPGEARR